MVEPGFPVICGKGERLRSRGDNVRRLLVCALLSLACGAAIPAAAGAQAAPTRDVLMVGNSSDGTVDVFDATTFQRLETINVIPDGSTPRDPIQALAYPTLTSKVGINYVQDIALSPDAKTLYVSRGYLGDVAAFDLSGCSSPRPPPTSSRSSTPPRTRSSARSRQATTRTRSGFRPMVRRCTAAVWAYSSSTRRPAPRRPPTGGTGSRRSILRPCCRSARPASSARAFARSR